MIDSDGMAGEYLDPCVARMDCRSELCLPNPVSGQSFCSVVCDGSSDCSASDVCMGPPDGVMGCLTVDTGKSCSTTTPETCLFGLCMAAGPGDGLCTRECATALDCPAGYSCSTVNGSGTGPRVCARVDQRCPGGAEDCVSGLCVKNTFCVGDCRSISDCPPNHDCTNVGATNVCLPMSGGVAGLGETCAAANQCRSGLCAGTCTTPCAVTRSWGQQCPVGWGCIPVDNGEGGNSLVCARSGTGVVGDACSDNEDCLWGLCVTTEGGDTLCSRFCNDGFCPSGFTCDAAEIVADGLSLQACAP